MQIVITEAVQDLQIVRHAPIVRVALIVIQVVHVVCAAVALLRKNLLFRKLFKKKSSGNSNNLKSGYSKQTLGKVKPSILLQQ